MNSIAILLTDNKSINEDIILKSFNCLKKSKLKKIFFIGDRYKFKKIYSKFNKNKKINFINIKIHKNNFYEYMNSITKKSIKLFDEKKIKFIINMPLNKKKYLKNYPGFTEFFSHKLDRQNNQNMLMFSDNFSVCPLTTHEEIKNIEKSLNKKKIINGIENVNNFFCKIIKKKPRIIVLGLNPHASKDMNKNNFDNKLLTSIIKTLKKKMSITGPVSADTAFNNPKNKIFIGMYHDQVLIPFKLINKFNGINVTIGKKITRMSPDHGTGINIRKLKKKINNESFLRCLDFCEKY